MENELNKLSENLEGLSQSLDKLQEGMADSIDALLEKMGELAEDIKALKKEISKMNGAEEDDYDEDDEAADNFIESFDND